MIVQLPPLKDPATWDRRYTPEQLREMQMEAMRAALDAAVLLCEEMREHWSAYKDTALLNGDLPLSNAASGEPRAAESLAVLIREMRDLSDDLRA